MPLTTFMLRSQIDRADVAGALKKSHFRVRHFGGVLHIAFEDSAYH
jgi:hypothetical protein